MCWAFATTETAVAADPEPTGGTGAAEAPEKAGAARAPGNIGAEKSAPSLEFEAFKDDAFIAARKSGSPVVLYFEADWCAPCREMHERTFRDPAVLAAASGIRLFRVDMTNPDSYHALLTKSFEVLGEPTVIVYGIEGTVRSRRFGFIPPTDFAKILSESRTPRPAP